MSIPSWPEQIFPLHAVQRWSAFVLGNQYAPTTLVPTIIYAAYTEPPDQRITARLAIVEGERVIREVVFKGNRFPQLSASAQAHALVSRHAKSMVPHVLGWDNTGNGGDSRLLYEPFEGSRISDIATPELLMATAHVLARIQLAVAASGEGEDEGIPRIRASDIPSLFESVYSHIQSHKEVWDTDEGGKLSKWLGFPASEVLEALTEARPQMQRNAEAVSALGLPNTIDHGDLHSGNAIVQADGDVLIYDWETATLGCPLFSLERLLVDAWRLDETPDDVGPWGYVAGTPTQALIRDAYLEALGRPDISTSLFAGAMSLAVIKEMYAEITWANLVGWPAGNPEWTAQLISRLRHHLVTQAS